MMASWCESVRTSNIHDHAQADQHIYAMPVTAYIASVEANMHTVKCILCIPGLYARAINIYCPSNLEMWPIKLDIGLTNGLPNITSYFGL